MSTTSQKHRNFVSEPMGNKSVYAIPGVGNAIGDRLKASGYSQAKNVLGKMLVKNEDKKSFENWMKKTTGANSKQANDAYYGLREWRKEFL